jgi:hypothetical protein
VCSDSWMDRHTDMAQVAITIFVAFSRQLTYIVLCILFCVRLYFLTAANVKMEISWLLRHVVCRKFADVSEVLADFIMREIRSYIRRRENLISHLVYFCREATLRCVRLFKVLWFTYCLYGGSSRHV